MKLSALWITKNEEANLELSMRSVMEVCDELVVVDTGSTDKTVEIAKSLGARIEHFDWVSDFAAARNYALSTVTGDVVIFLDADEWFEPALEKKDLVWIEDFYQSGMDVYQIQRVDVDTKTGGVQGRIIIERFLRRGAVRYKGEIHEIVVRTDGGPPKAMMDAGREVLHSGYDPAGIERKTRRNLEILEDIIRTGEAKSGVPLASAYFYAVRECKTLDDDKAVEYLLWLLKHPKEVKDFLELYRKAATVYLHNAAMVATHWRTKISRRMLRRGTVTVLEELRHANPVKEVAAPYYNRYFEENIEELTRGFDARYARLEKMKDSQEELFDTDFPIIAEEVYVDVARAYRLYRDKAKMFDWLNRAVQISDTKGTEGELNLLLHCMRGLPAQDVVVYLNNLLPLQRKNVLSNLVRAARYEGWREVYAYYSKKLLETGWGSRLDLWFLKLVLGDVEGVLALEAGAGEEQEELAGRALFLAVICSGGEAAVVARVKGRLGRYAPVADAFVANVALPEADLTVLRDNYGLVAFAAGRQAAERLAGVFAGQPVFVWDVRRRYYNESGLYAEFTGAGGWQPGEEDGPRSLELAEMLWLGGDDSRAMQRLDAYFAQHGPNYGALNLCRAIASTAGAEAIRQRAQGLVDVYAPLYEEFIDLADVANTGVVFDVDDKKKRKQLAGMPLKELEQWAVKAAVPAFGGQLQAYAGAARVYFEQKCYYAAVQCLCRLAGYSGGLDALDGEAAGMLGQAFEAVGNKALAERFPR